MGDVLAVKLTFYNTVAALAHKLKSIFVPYFDVLFDDCEQELRTSKDEDRSPVMKKRKKHKTKDCQFAEEVRLLSTSDKCLKLKLLRAVTRALHQCFANDDDPESKFMVPDRVEQVASSLISALHLANIDMQLASDHIVPCIAQLAVTVR